MPARCSKAPELDFSSGMPWRKRIKDHTAVPKLPSTKEIRGAKVCVGDGELNLVHNGLSSLLPSQRH